MERWSEYPWMNAFCTVSPFKAYNHNQDIYQINTLLARYDLKVNSYIDSPTLTTYIVNLKVDSKINSILRLEKNFQIACNDNNVRLYLDGDKLCIEKKGAENTVKIRNLIPEGFIGQKRLLFGIGLDNTGKKTFYDLNKAPHMLVAGTTGSGKSIFLHQVLVTLLMNHYNDADFVIIDPKGTEFGIYNALSNVTYTSDVNRSISMMKDLVDQMENRYTTLRNNGCRDIDSFNANGTRMKHTVCVIDEFADLIMTNPKVEDYVVRLAQKARAAGIHLIIATQRPVAEVITGLIKANIPTRIALKVTNSLESRLILDRNGAEKLNGKGDLLFLANGKFEPIRCQSAYIIEEELNNFLWKAYIEAGGDISKLTCRKIHVNW